MSKKYIGICQSYYFCFQNSIRLELISISDSLLKLYINALESVLGAFRVISCPDQYQSPIVSNERILYRNVDLLSPIEYNSFFQSIQKPEFQDKHIIFTTAQPSKQADVLSVNCAFEVHSEALYNLIFSQLVLEYNQYKIRIKSPLENTFHLIERFVFKKLQKGYFQLILDGKEIILKNMKSDGLFYIYMIMKHTTISNPIHARDLYSSKLENRSTLKQADIEDYSTYDKGERSKPVENEELKNLKEELRYYKEQLIDAKFYGNDSHILLLNERIDETKKEIDEKSPYKIKTPDQRMKTAIDKAIKGVLDELQGRYPQFYKYLKGSIIYSRREYKYYFNDPSNIYWIID